MTKNTLYIDMDGVVADWSAGATEIIGYSLHNASAYYPPEHWVKVTECKRLYRNLPKMPGADEMVDTARKFRDDLGWELLFLTAVPKSNDVRWAFYDKVHWVLERYPEIPVHFGPYSKDKHVHCKPGDVLVDDRVENIHEWVGAGGHGILVGLNEVPKATTELLHHFHRLYNNLL